MKINRIEISFPVGIEFPAGFDQALDALVNMVCKAYEAQNPTRVMWPAGAGSKPKFSVADSIFLGKAPDADAPDAGEPTFDDSVYEISVAEREDYHGQNPANPERERLRDEALVARKAARAAKAVAP